MKHILQFNKELQDNYIRLPNQISLIYSSRLSQLKQSYYQDQISLCFSLKASFNNKLYYFGWAGAKSQNSHDASADAIQINQSFGRLLGLQNNQPVLLKQIQVKRAENVQIEPVSFDDFQFVQQNCQAIQQNLLNQISILQRGLVFPFYLPLKKIQIRLQVSDSAFQSQNAYYLSLNSELYIQQKVRKRKQISEQQEEEEVKVLDKAERKIENIQHQNNDIEQPEQPIQLPQTKELKIKKLSDLNFYKLKTNQDLSWRRDILFIHPNSLIEQNTIACIQVNNSTESLCSTDFSEFLRLKQNNQDISFERESTKLYKVTRFNPFIQQNVCECNDKFIENKSNALLLHPCVIQQTDNTHVVQTSIQDHFKINLTTPLKVVMFYQDNPFLEKLISELIFRIVRSQNNYPVIISNEIQISKGLLLSYIQNVQDQIDVETSNTMISLIEAISKELQEQLQQGENIQQQLAINIKINKIGSENSILVIKDEEQSHIFFKSLSSSSQFELDQLQ